MKEDCFCSHCSDGMCMLKERRSTLALFVLRSEPQDISFSTSTIIVRSCLNKFQSSSVTYFNNYIIVFCC